MDKTQVGTRWRAKVNMRLPGKGPVGPGDEFIFTQQHADAGLLPELWLELGHAEPLGSTRSLSATVAEAKPDTKPQARPRFAARGSSSEAKSDDPAPADDKEAAE